MKGRMFVVNSKTLERTKSSMIASIKTPDLTGKKWLSTVADIMADLLQIEIGDYIFLWETRSDTQKSRIHGVYRAISKPFYKCDNKNDKAPFKIHIEKAYEFDQPLDEYDVLNCPYIKSSMWTIIGKKVKGKPRGTSPLSLEEIGILIKLLIGKNMNYKFYEFDEKRCITVKDNLLIDYSKRGDNRKPTSLMTLRPNELNYFKETGELYYEKILETILNQEMTNRNKSFFDGIGVNVDDVIWYSNYLPYSIEQSEMDYVIIESKDGIAYSRIYLIELMLGNIDETHIRRALMYSKWINDTLALGTNFVKPIIITSESYDYIKGESDPRKLRAFNKRKILLNHIENEYGLLPLEIYEYDISEKVQRFIRKKG